jgi:hypothetical protein
MTVIPGTDLNLITITGTYLTTPNGDPASGTVTFTPSQQRLRDEEVVPTDGRIIVLDDWVADLDAAGQLMEDGGVDAATDPFVVAATNDPDVDPTGWAYTITETVSGMVNTFTAVIPYDAAGSTIDITQLVPIQGSSGAVAIPLNVVGGVPTLIDGGGGVPQINPDQLPSLVAGVSSIEGRTGAVTLGDLYAPLAHTHVAAQITDGASVFAPFTHNHDVAYLSQSEGDALYVSVNTPLYRPSTQQTTVRDMYWGGSSGHPFVNVGTGGTVNVNDTTVFALGDRSIKLTSTTGSPADVAAGAGGLASFDITGLLPVVWLRVENPSVITQLRVWLGNAANNLGYVWDLVETSDWPYIPDAAGLGPNEGFVRISLPFGRTTLNNAPPDLADLGTIRVDVTGTGASEAIVYWGGIGFADLQNLYPTGAITLLFPGGRKSCLTQAKSYMDRRGYAGVIPIVTETLRDPGTYSATYLTLAEAHMLEDMSGWEIVTSAHSKTVADQTTNQGGSGDTGYTAYASPQQVSDMNAAKTYLYSQGFRSPDLLHYPQGAWDAAARLNAKAIFGLAVTDNEPGSNETLPVADPAKVRATRFTSSTTSGQMDTFVEQIRSSPGGDWGIVLIEDIVTTPANPWEISTANFQAFIDKIAAEGVEVFTLSEILAGV